VGVHRVDFDQRIPEPERLALSVTEPGARAQDVLRAQALSATWGDQPDDALQRLAASYYATTNRDVLYALAELSYLRARDERSSPSRAAPRWLACVVYSYVYLDGLPPSLPGVPVDVAAQRVLAYYNYALGRCLLLAERTQLRYTPGVRLRMPDGYVTLVHRDYGLLWRPEELDEYKLAYEYEAEGMDVYQVTRGIGVPMIGIRRPPTLENVDAAERYLPQIELTYAATILLRVASPATVDARGRRIWRATLEICDPIETDTVPVGPRTLPLAADLTTPLAYMIEQTPKVSGFAGMLDPASYEHIEGLYMLQPYQADKIPVVFVHGLMSTPQAWLQMLNSLMGDPLLRKRCQFWFFRYPTGNPMLYSASLLRESLKQVRQQYDPVGTNAAFNRMVIVSHSMGGLLTKTLVQTSGDRIWHLLADVPPEQLNLTGDERALVDKVLFFEAQPYIARVVFMATPHRGSHMATRPIARLGALLTDLPERLVRPGEKLAARVVARGAATPHSDVAARIERSVTGIDSLSPDNPALGVLCDLPIAVPFHSIIGNNEQAGVPGGTDGIVPYTSSHLEGAQSELIVKSDHSVEMNLNAINEVRRILLQHLQAR
jgi:pimeloyl-ACP methyl ester carboxylesterase